MHIDHIAIWVTDLEKMREFYTRFFNMKSNDGYINEKKQFSSYFMSFENGTRIELMHRPDIDGQNGPEECFGISHLAFSVGSREEVERLTQSIREADYTIAGEPRLTGDGYYESVILDPEGNRIEITE